MMNLLRNIDNWNIHYYNIFPIIIDKDEANKNKVIPNYAALLVNNDEKEHLSLDKKIEFSQKIQNLPILFAESGKDNTFDYNLDFYFNGYKIKLFSFSIFALLRYLYDQSILRTSLNLNIGNFTIKGSSRPDDDMNFFIRYTYPKIDELNYSLYEILSCLDLSAENLDPNHSICQMESELINIIPLPIKNMKNFSQVKPQTGNIVSLRREHKDLPSLLSYVIGDDGKTIQSRFYSTHSIIMEMACTPIEASMLHYFLMKIDKNLQYDIIRHYQGEKISRPTRLITKVDHSQSKETVLMSGGEVYPI
jgi:predicted PhzF superfamily epimerase YddE/YHI9